MTKTFSYFHDKQRWTKEEFYEYFEDKDYMFGSWLVYSFAMIVHDDKIQRVDATIRNGVAKYWILYNDRHEWAAGDEECMCATDLLNGFIDRINHPDLFKYNGLP